MSLAGIEGYDPTRRSAGPAEMLEMSHLQSASTNFAVSSNSRTTGFGPVNGGASPPAAANFSFWVASFNSEAAGS